MINEKSNLDDDKIETIFEEYTNGKSILSISKSIGKSPTFVNNLIKSKDFESQISLNYPQFDDKEMVVICKITNKTFSDYWNKSGCLTTHIKLTYPNIVLPSPYKLKCQEYKTGKFWYHNYFNFEYRDIKPIFKCKLCNWTTEDVANESGAYEKHLKNIHNIDLQDYMKQFPEDRSYFKKEIYDELVECAICGEKLKIINNTHLSTHCITTTEYKLKYNTSTISPQSHEKLLKSYNEVLRCSGFIKTSKLEQFIIDNVDIKFDQSNRKLLNGKEIDLTHHETKNCFELNGCIYHSEIFGKKDSKYHLNKTLKCNISGYSLYHVFEDEIMYKPNIVLSKIRNILGISTANVIHARKCEIFQLTDLKQKRIFLDDNHIQGNDSSKICIVAKYNDEIVALMCFDNKRSMSKTNDHDETTYELTRFCVKINNRITGIANRLLKFFITNYNPTKIISFADIRWTPNSENNLYTKLNFKLTKTLKPDYTYYNPKIDRYKRFHKFGFGKTNLKKKFPGIYDDSKTEWEMMQELGYDRIWDCGKYKYELTI